MRKRLRTKTAGKLLNEIRSVFMSNGNTFESDLATGLPKIVVPVDTNHTDLFLYRVDGNRMTELSYGVPDNGNWGDDVDWTVSRVNINDGSFYVTLNPNSQRARVNGSLAGAYRVGAGVEDNGEYIDFTLNPSNALTNLREDQYITGAIGIGPIGTTTYFLDGSRRKSRANDDSGLNIPPQNNGVSGNGGKNQPNPNDLPEKDTVNEWHPPAEGVDGGDSANTPEDIDVEDEVQEKEDESGSEEPQKGTLIFKNFPPCGDITINGKKYEADLWYRNDISYGIVKRVPYGPNEVSITFGGITFEDTIDLGGRTERVFLDMFPIVYFIGLKKNWGVNINDTSVPCIHDIYSNLAIITAPNEGMQKFTIKMGGKNRKEFDMNIPIGYTVINLDRYETDSEEKDSTQFWTEKQRVPRRAPRMAPPREQPTILIDPSYEDRFDRRRHRDIDSGPGGYIDPFGEYTMGAGRLSSAKSMLPFMAGVLVGYLAYKSVKK